MREDTGIITLTVTNTGDNSVTIKEADLYAKELTILNYQAYAASGTIGPGNSMDYTFTIQANAPEIPWIIPLPSRQMPRMVSTV